MNWDQVSGQWKQFRGKVKSMWGKLTGDDLKNLGGKKDSLVGNIQERYGIAKEGVDQRLGKIGRTVDDKKGPLPSV